MIARLKLAAEVGWVALPQESMEARSLASGDRRMTAD
jgi:hypothetical protein